MSEDQPTKPIDVGILPEIVQYVHGLDEQADQHESYSSYLEGATEELDQAIRSILKAHIHSFTEAWTDELDLIADQFNVPEGEEDGVEVFLEELQAGNIDSAVDELEHHQLLAVAMVANRADSVIRLQREVERGSLSVVDQVTEQEAN